MDLFKDFKQFQLGLIQIHFLKLFALEKYSFFNNLHILSWIIIFKCKKCFKYAFSLKISKSGCDMDMWFLWTRIPIISLAFISILFHYSFVQWNIFIFKAQFFWLLQFEFGSQNKWIAIVFSA